jgi:hypothetical protein
MNSVTIFAKTARGKLVAVSYDAEGIVTEVRVEFWPANAASFNRAWRRLTRGRTPMRSCAVRAANAIRDVFHRFYTSYEWENPLPYVRSIGSGPGKLEMAFEAQAAFPLCVVAQ